MALPPIVVQLSKFEQLEILRAEIDTREEELKQTERQIREALFALERQRYLQSLHPLFRILQPPAATAVLPQMQANRDALSEALEVMRNTLATLERETAGLTPPAKPNAAGLPGLQKKKFDSFDDFRSARV